MANEHAGCMREMDLLRAERDTLRARVAALEAALVAADALAEAADKKGPISLAPYVDAYLAVRQKGA